MNKSILITGCSGGGKSTLIENLAQRGHCVVRETGLRVIQEQGIKPWEDRDGFIRAIIALSQRDLEEHKGASDWVFFDRGTFDGLSGLAARQKKAVQELMPGPFPYAPPVFFAPPWPEIFEQTAHRPHSFEFALEEAVRLKEDLKVLGVHTVELPKQSAGQRADFMLRNLAEI